MEYFKHYSTASDSKSLNIIFDKFGHKGIAFWWLLVELCAENWDGESEPEFCFHQRTVATKLKSSVNSVRPWLELCSDSGLCAFAHFETQIEIKMPKLREVKETRGRIKGNKSKKTGIYRLDKEEDKDLDNTSKKNLPEVSPLNFRNPKDFVKPDQLIQLFNDMLAGKGKIKHCRGLSGKNIQDFQITTSYEEFTKIDTWKEIFTTVAQSEFLTGQQQGSSFVATLNWLICHDKALSVLNGQYGSGSGENDFKELFSLIPEGA